MSRKFQVQQKSRVKKKRERNKVNSGGEKARERGFLLLVEGSAWVARVNVASFYFQPASSPSTKIENRLLYASLFLVSNGSFLSSRVFLLIARG